MRGSYIAILTVFIALLWSSSGALAQDEYARYDELCKPTEQTKINVRPATQPVKYDYSKSIAQMQNIESDTVNPYSYHAVTRTQGLMEGAIKVEQEIKLGNKKMQNYGGLCVWYKEINIDIEIDPTIHIAREVHEDKCMNQAVLAHEMGHVKIDRQLVNEYSSKIGQALYDELKQRGFVAFVPMKEMQSAGYRMQKTVYQIVEHEYKRMELDRIDRQRAHDTLEEYNRVSQECPDFNSRL